MYTYSVGVYKCGVRQGTREVQATDGLLACNQVEAEMGLKSPQFSIDVRTGEMVVANWQGYEFRARRLL